LKLQYSQSEEKLQKNCVAWFNLQYPKLRGLLCYNLNNSRNKIDGAKNKALGLVAGRADVVLYRHGVATMIEFKIRDGTQSELQKEWQKIIEKENFEYYIIRDLDSFINLIRSKI
jgi:hypothetical protein